VRGIYRTEHHDGYSALGVAEQLVEEVTPEMEGFSGAPVVLGSGAASNGVVGLLTYYPPPERVIDLRRSIGGLQVLRSDVAALGLVAYSAVVSSRPNYTAAVSFLESAPRLTVTYSPVGTAPIVSPTVADISFEYFRPWSTTSAPLSPGPRMPYGYASLSRPWLKLTLGDDVFSADSKAVLLRFVDGVIAALCLLLVRVMAAIARHPDVLTFVLVMLAVCLRYGRRGEPDDYALPAHAPI
jgi:hypothetical protein